MERMISYAHNREDVLLERLFRDLDTGFYIDVGAGQPTKGSLTRHFYDRGWRGLNLEPAATLFDSLQSEGPEDSNLRVAISNRSGSVNLYEFAGQEWGLSTVSYEQAERHAQAGLQHETRTARSATLTEIFEENVTGEIQFLSIDVEDLETQLAAALALNQDLKRSESILLAEQENFRDRLERLEAECRRLAAKVGDLNATPRRAAPKPGPECYRG